MSIDGTSQVNEENGSHQATKCAIYARAVRSPNQSVESQIEICLTDARQQGFVVVDSHIYRDEGRDRYISFGERPGIKGLLDAARSEARPFEVVLVDNNARFSRKYQEMLSVYSALSKAGVRVRVALTRHIDPVQALWMK